MSGSILGSVREVISWGLDWLPSHCGCELRGRGRNATQNLLNIRPIVPWRRPDQAESGSAASGVPTPSGSAPRAGNSQVSKGRRRMEKFIVRWIREPRLSPESRVSHGREPLSTDDADLRLHTRRGRRDLHRSADSAMHVQSVHRDAVSGIAARSRSIAAFNRLSPRSGCNSKNTSTS